MAGADLHLHTTASDGADGPVVVCRRAREAGLVTIAIADHDSVGAVAQAREEGSRIGLEVISACELTAYRGEEEIHILGYGIKIDDPDLSEHLETFRAARRRRLDEMADRLERAGVPIELDRVLSMAGGEGAVGRVHVARALLEAGHVSTLQEAFERFLIQGRPAYVAKLSIDPERIIEVIHKAGGVAVLAHPAINGLEPAVPELVQAGLDGIEVWHSLHRRDQSENLFLLAQRHGLLKTGGSDCHGALPGRNPIVGTVRIDRNHVEALLRAVDRRRRAAKE